MPDTPTPEPPAISRILRPNAPNPNEPTIWVCTSCGQTQHLVSGLVAVVTEQHNRGCVGPKLDAIWKLLQHMAGLEPAPALDA